MTPELPAPVNPVVLREHETEIRVRYQETDGQGRAYHGNYVTWFEVGRVELLRAAGVDYKALEEAGVFLVVAELSLNFFGAARFDDLIRVRTRTARSRGVRIENHYEIRRDDELLASGRTVVACVDATGKVKPLPAWLRLPLVEADQDESQSSLG
ncbi:acyl-CoA thioesterase [Lignipirellula cremea]|uniref:Acyl-CoA thioester hydrolase YbgC n=1 Tax=Lignipirellula cremea TaxID=2528010 RepID=A0A518DV19_9BACT|nr:thioesterase family protein [Lignipirellula cremea]QDU95683.1 Acyl-CoA thioester hydrolase YbgC [Lignipirellula cremea]